MFSRTKFPSLDFVISRVHPTFALYRFSLDQDIGCIAKKPNVPQLLLGMGYTANQSKCPTMFVGLTPVLQRLWEVYTLTNHAICTP